MAISGYHMICGLDLMKKLHIGVTNIPLLHPSSSQQLLVASINEGSIPVNQLPAFQEALERNKETQEYACSHSDAFVILEVDQSKLKFVNQYPIEQANHPFVDQRIQGWLRESVVRRASESNVFCSPLWTVRKYNVNGSVDKKSRRVCLDARRLNEALTNNDTFPVPLIRDIFSRLKGARVFSEIHIRMAYTQFPVAEQSQNLLGFRLTNQIQ